MASIVIITKQCYLLCDAINYIVINEVEEDDKNQVRMFLNRPSKRGRKAKPKKLTKKQLDLINGRQFQIIIDFIPVGNSNNNSGNNSMTRKSGSETTTVAITVTGRDKCLELFSHMVEQIREQIPDHMFLDRIVERFLQESKEYEPTSL